MSRVAARATVHAPPRFPSPPQPARRGGARGAVPSRPPSQCGSWFLVVVPIFGAIYMAVYSKGAPATRDLQRIEATSRSPIFTQVRRAAHIPLRLRPPTHAHTRATRNTPREHPTSTRHATRCACRMRTHARMRTRRG